MDLISQILVALADPQEEDPLQIVEHLDQIQDNIKFKFFMQVDEELSVFHSPRTKEPNEDPDK